MTPFACQLTAVAINGRAILIDGAPGSGKSSLALALIDRGAVLIGDDGVMLKAHGENLAVRPHPSTHGLIEVRNLGLLTFPVCSEAYAGLVVRLAPDAPRFIEQPGRAEYLGVALPFIALASSGPNLALKTELALSNFGTGSAMFEINNR